MNKKQLPLVISLSLVVGLIGGVVSGQLIQLLPQHGKVVKAEQFIVVDEHGQARAKLALQHKTKPCLTLLDRHGQERIELSVIWDGKTSLSFMDEDGKSRVSLGLSPSEVDEDPHLFFMDKDRRTRLALQLLREGHPHLSLASNEEQQAEASLLIIDGSPVLLLKEGDIGTTALAVGVDGLTSIDTAEHNLARLVLKPDAEPRLSLSGKNRDVVWVAP